MAGINNIPYTPWAQVGSPDFSPLAKLADTYRQGQMRAELAQLAANGQQPSLEQVAQVALRHGDTDAFKGLAQLAQGNAYQMANLGLRNREVGVQERLAAQRPQADLTDLYDPVTGQPQRALVNRQTGATQTLGGVKQDRKDLSVSDITKLSEEGGKFASLIDSVKTFRPEYGGWGSQALGELSNTLTSNMPSWVPALDPEKAKSRDEGAAFWREYSRQKSVARHELYGSALTPGERKDYEAADINPGMNPEQIKRNLATQQRILETGIKRKAAAMLEAGYKPEQVSKAYGIDLGGMGVPARGQPVAGGAPSSAPAVTPSAALSEARAALAKRPDLRDAVIQRLKEKGIDPTGL
jgi:hypothetical protein